MARLSRFMLLAGASALLGATLVLLAALVPTDRWAELFAHPLRVQREGSIPETTVAGAGLVRLALLLVGVAIAAAPWVLRRLMAIGPDDGDALDGGLEPIRPVEQWALLGVLALGAVVRLPRLLESLWYDEISALLDFAQYGPGPIAANYFAQSNHIGHTMATWVSITIAGGANEPVVRMPAWLASLAAILAVWALARDGAPRRPSLRLAAAAAMALMPVCVLEGVEARGYSMMMAGAAASSWAFLRAERCRTPGAWMLYAGLTALGVWAHMVTVCVPLGHGVLVVLDGVRGRRARIVLAPLAGLVLAALTTLLLYAPALPDIMVRRSEFSAADGDEPSLFGVEGWHALLQLGGAWAWWAAVPALALVGCGVASVRRDARLRRAILAAGIGLPVALLLVWIGDRWLYARFLLFAVPAAALLMAAGWHALPRAAGVVAAVVVLAAWSGDLLTRPAKQPLRDAVLEVAGARQPGERVGAIGLIDNVLVYYGSAHDVEIHDSGVSGADLDAMLAAHRPSWIILYYPATVPADRYLRLEESGFELHRRHAGWVDWNNGDVLVYRRRPEE